MSDPRRPPDLPIAPFPLDGGRVGDGGGGTEAKDLAREAQAEIPSSPPAKRPRVADAGKFDHRPHAHGAVMRSRRLRREMTHSEARLWAALSKLRLNIRRQAPIGPYFGDFVQHGARLVVEVDGGIHRLEQVQVRDAARDEWLREQGYTVIRVSNAEVNGDLLGVVRRIEAIVVSRGIRPRPLK